MTTTVDVMDTLGMCDTDQTSRAAVRVKLKSGGELEFCLHHWDLLELQMISAGAILVNDQREALSTK